MARGARAEGGRLPGPLVRHPHLCGARGGSGDRTRPRGGPAPRATASRDPEPGWGLVSHSGHGALGDGHWHGPGVAHALPARGAPVHGARPPRARGPPGARRRLDRATADARATALHHRLPHAGARARRAWNGLRAPGRASAPIRPRGALSGAHLIAEARAAQDGPESIPPFNWTRLEGKRRTRL